MGQIREATTERMRKPAMVPSEATMGTLYQSAMTIFPPTKRRTRAEADLEVVELVDDAGQEEVHGAQAEDGEDVGGVDDERVGGDGEDRGDGVDGEDDVGGFDGDEDEQQRRGEALAVLRR